MSSLDKCLLRFVRGADARAVREASLEYKARGKEDQDANIAAIQDKLHELKAEEKRIVTAVREAAVRDGFELTETPLAKLERHSRERDARNIAHVIDEFTRNGIALVNHPEPGWQYVMTKTVSDDGGTGPVRVSEFYNEAPRGHTVYDSVEEAAAKMSAGGTLVRGFGQQLMAAEPGFKLAGETPTEAKIAAMLKAHNAATEAKKAAAPPPESFTLTGSDRKRDLTPGQRDIFEAADTFVQKSLDALKLVPAQDNAKARTAREAAIRELTQAGRLNVLAASINVDMLKEGRASLLGQRVTSTADLATVAQVARDPRFETLRYVFVKDGKVVHETAVSSRLPAAASSFAGTDWADFANGLRRSIERTEADGFYMLHNHPSGNATASFADTTMTRTIAQQFPNKFIGHVVIDTDQYSVIHASGDHELIKADLGGAEPQSTKAPAVKPAPGSAAEDILGSPLSDPKHVFRMGRQLYTRDHVALIALGGGSDGVVVGIADMPLSTFGTDMRTKGAINRFAKASGAGGGVFVANLPESHAEIGRHLVTKGILRDVVMDTSASMQNRIFGQGGHIERPYEYLGRQQLRGHMVGETPSPYDSKDLFGDAPKVTVTIKKRIRTVAPEMADLFDMPSSKVDTPAKPEGLFHGPTENDTRGVAGAKPEPVPATTGEREAAGVLPGAGGRDTGSSLERDGRQPGGAEGVQPEQQADVDRESGRGEHAASDDKGASAGRLSGVPAGRDIPTKTGRNFAFGSDDLTYEGSWRSKGIANLAAIKLLRTLDSEGRQATRAEQAVLARYVGWGSSELANKVFIPDNQAWKLDDNWGKLRDEIKATLTPEEFADASKSTQYAHWTSKEVVRGMWSAVRRLGYQGGAMLEPGAGIGVFPGLMRADMANNTIYTGIEFDPLTGGILKQLFPDERIVVGDFIKTPLPKDFYDMAIGNWPFANTPILSDPEYRKHGFLLHDYFFAKTLDRVKPGGLVVAVTSHGTLDKRNAKAREYIAERADLVGAIRLPQTAFKKNAGTEVVTDVLFLRKKVPGEPFEQAQKWLDVAPVLNTPEGQLFVNEYFHAHPEMVLGTHSSAGTMRRKHEYTVLPRPEGEIEQHFLDAVAHLPADVYRAEIGTSSAAAKVQQLDFDPKAKKEGGYYLSPSGVLMRVKDGVGAIAATQDPVLKAYVPLRDALKQAQYDQLNNGPWEESLAALQKAYQKFVKNNDRIQAHTPYERTTKVTDAITGEKIENTTKYRRWKHQNVLHDDPDYWLVAALESIDEETDKISETAALRERVLEKPKEPKIETAADALLASLNDLGEVDIPRIAELAGISEKEAIASLEGSIYKAPDGKYQTADEYLSGDVRKKLDEATTAAASDRSFAVNVEALKRVQPREKPHDEINVKLGMNFIPPDVYDAFAREKLGIHELKTDFVKATGRWIVTHGYGRDSPFNTGNMSASAILDHAMNGAPIRVMRTEAVEGGGTREVFDAAQTAAANLKLDEMNDAFKTWLWSDQARTRTLSRAYNDRFNTVVPRQFNGDHLTLPGASKLFDIFPHVKRGAWRIIQSGNTYLAHPVGSGKTFEMIIAAMEQKRLGLANKQMMVVPRHMLRQFSSEWQALYPTARLMIADEENFHTDVRREFVSRAALSDLDGIVMTHSSFKLLDLDPAFKRKMIEQELAIYREALIEAGGKDEPTYSNKGKRIYSRDPKIKQIEHAMERLNQKLEAAISSADKDKGSPRFDEMGVDMLYIDEAHEYRRLGFTTQRQAKGIQPMGSDQAFDLYLKSRWLDEKKPGRSLVMSSGTPITNTVAELYNVMRMMDPKALEERGLSRFDEWATMFGREDTRLEPDAAGEYDNVTRFTKFVNMPELAQLFRNFADVLTPDQLGKLLGDKRPSLKGGARKIVVAPMTPELRAYREELKARMLASRDWKPSFGEPNNPDPIIRIIGDGRLAAIDMRFVDPTLPSNPKSKLNTMADNIIARYKQANQADAPVDHQTQIVFSDIGFGEGVTKSRGFDARAAFEKRLQAGGIPRGEIAFIQDFNTAQKRLALFRRVNEGKVRVLVGGSRNLGTGTNAQRRLVAGHQLDTPWFPAHVEQREGRFIRAGNLNKEVESYGYATKGSYDETMWKLVAIKQRFIDQALSGDPNLREIEDVSEVSAYEMASAMLADDPRVLQLAGLRSEVEQLRRLYEAHNDDVRRAGRELDMAEGQIDRLQKRAIPAAVEAAKSVTDLSGDKFVATVEGKTFDKRKDFGEAIQARFGKLAAQITEGQQTLGSISGFPIGFMGVIRRNAKNKIEGYDSAVFLKAAGGEHILAHEPTDDPVGLAMRAVNVITEIGRAPARLREFLAEQNATAHALRPKIDAKFPMLDELRDKQAEESKLEDDIKGNPYIDPTEPEEPPAAEAPQTPYGARDEPPPNARGHRERAGRGPTEPSQEARHSAFGYSMYETVAPQERKSIRGAILDAFKKLFLPSTRGALAKLQAGLMRANLGRMARDAELANVQFKKYAAAFHKLSQADQVAFTNRYERGEAQPTPAMREAADAIREFNRQLREELQALGKLDEFNHNYLGRIWLDPEARVSSVFARRPLEGSKNFLKRRVYEYFSEGLAAGLKPITYNPIEMMLLKGVEQRRFIYGQKIFREMKDAGLVRSVAYDAVPPEGWTALNDKIARSPQGRFYAPDEAATLFNNHLSPGLRGNAAYDAYHKAGMMLNSAQLGLSLFHAGFTTLDAMVSKAALGIQQLSRGQMLKGFGNVVQAFNPLQPFINAYKGDRLLRAYLGELNDPTLAPIIEALVQGGGRVRMDEFYRNATLNAFKQALARNDKLGVLKGLLPSILDRINAPIFEQLVPRQKLGIFFDMAKDWIERNPNATVEAKRAAMGKFWDSVDNRLGQLVYDNVFWNRTLKDMLMVSVRSVGWNLGTFRELGGGIADVRGILRDKELSSRTAYVIALPFLTGLMGSMIGYMYTGNGPDELKDYFFPKTGRKRQDGSDDRLSLPSYMKDVFEYGHDISGFLKYGANPTQTLQNKLHPMLGAVAQMLNNQDFFGGAIRSPGDPVMVQLADEAKYLGKQLAPFALRNYLQQAQTKQEEPNVAGYFTAPSLFGITPSPGYITKTAQQTEAASLSRMKDSLISKFRQEVRDGAPPAEIAKRAFAAGLRLPEVTMIVRQGLTPQGAGSRTPPRRLTVPE